MEHPMRITQEPIQRMIPNPAWNASVEFQQAKEFAQWMGGEFPEDVFPEDYGKGLPEDGGWIILLTSVHCGKQLEISMVKSIVVPHLSIWFALPFTTKNVKVLQHATRKRPEITAPLKQAVIQTPDGQVHVWPHEYNLCNIEKFLEFSEEDGFYTHFLSSSGGFDEQSLFYLRSRGISKADAQRMLLTSLKDPYYCYFTFHQSISGSVGDGTGMSSMSPRNRVRRARAHRKIGRL